MKKFTLMATAILLAFFCTAQFTTTVKAFPTDDITSYYDFDKNEIINISDVLRAVELLDDGKLSEGDLTNVCKILLGDNVDMEFNEFDIDDMEVNDESIFKIQAICSSYCIGYEFDGECVRYCFLNDGVVTEMRCSNIDVSETIIAIPVYDNVQNVIGITPDGKFVIDSYKSFDLPHEFSTYEQWDLDDCSLQFAEQLLKTSGKFENFMVNSELYGITSVRFFFNNGVTINELDLKRIAPVEKILRTFIYDGEKISVGITTDGTIALDNYSFDIAE